MDPYTRRARLYPALVTLVPVAAVGIALVPLPTESWKALLALLASSGALTLGVELGRTFGRRAEPRLFERWGGPPTTVLLRLTGTRNPEEAAQFRSAVERGTGMVLPTQAEESRDQASSDRRLEVAVANLRTQMRDAKAFPLSFQENASYGFRRNLYGLRVFGSVLGVLALVGAGVLLYFDAEGTVRASSAALAIGGLIAICWVGLLLLVIREDWVKEQAYTYARQLLREASNVAPR
jgi:hypothetical protein